MKLLRYQNTFRVGRYSLSSVFRTECGTSDGELGMTYSFSMRRNGSDYSVDGATFAATDERLEPLMAKAANRFLERIGISERVQEGDIRLEKYYADAPDSKRGSKKAV